MSFNPLSPFLLHLFSSSSFYNSPSKPYIRDVILNSQPNFISSKDPTQSLVKPVTPEIVTMIDFVLDYRLH